MSEMVTIPREVLVLLRQYVAEADPYGDAPMLLRDIDTALAAGEARPVPTAIGYVRGDGTLCAGCPPISEPDGWRPLYAAPPPPAVEAEREVDRTYGQLVTELTMRAVSGQHGPVFGPGGRELAAKLAQSPPEARAFLQRAGILGPDGLLAPEFRPDEEADPPQPADGWQLEARRYCANAEYWRERAEKAEALVAALSVGSGGSGS